jgi:hypothetical protein
MKQWKTKRGNGKNGATGHATGGMLYLLTGTPRGGFVLHVAPKWYLQGSPNAGGGFSSIRAFPSIDEVENPHEVEIPLQKGSLAEQQSVLWSFIALSP